MRSIEQAGISVDRQVSAPAAIETTARPLTADIEDAPPAGDMPPIEAAPVDDLTTSPDPRDATAPAISLDDRRALARSPAG
jgi:hypothetical protein